MPEVIFNGPEGRLEGRLQPGRAPNAPIALVLHPHPQYGGTMNNKIVYHLFQVFARRGFTTLRFNFRGVGRSEGHYDNGVGELSDAAAALDWLQSHYPDAPFAWIGGFSFGAWIAMQVLMRRPEIHGFVCVAPPANKYDFSFLAPCPSSGLIVQGTRDEIVTPSSVEKLIEKLRQQKRITVDLELVEGADHFFHGQIDELVAIVDRYLDQRLGATPKLAAARD